MPTFDKAKAIEVLVKTKEVLNTGWTKGVWARTSTGSAVHELSTAACCWCLGGALLKAEESVKAGLAIGYKIRQILKRVVYERPDSLFGLKDGECDFGIVSLVDFNDDPKTQFSDVLQVVDSAISELEGKKDE